jgi:hypothetical protein
MSTGPDENAQLLAAAEAIASRRQVDWQRLHQECDTATVRNLQTIEKLLPLFATAAAQWPPAAGKGELLIGHRDDGDLPQPHSDPPSTIAQAAMALPPPKKPVSLFPFLAACAALILLGLAILSLRPR